jgi:hypothetical protein
VNVTISSPYLVDGSYPVSIWFSDGIAKGEHIFHKEKCVSLKVSNMNNSFIKKTPRQGLIIPVCEWQFN